MDIPSKLEKNKPLTKIKRENMERWLNKIHEGDAVEVMKEMPDKFIDMAITSPPYYGLRDYGMDGQIGLEETLDEYLDRMLEVTAELHRVLKPKGTLWWVHGDSYGANYRGGGVDNASEKQKSNRGTPAFMGKSGSADKCLTLQNFRLVQRMIDEQGWILRNVIIWYKPNCMPSSAKDRFTVDFEPIFFFSKEKQYYFEQQFEPVKEISLERAKYSWETHRPSAKGAQGKHEKMGKRFVNPKGRNKRTVWEIPTTSFPEAHFAVYPEELITTPIKAGCPEGGIVLDPFMGAGTTGVVAKKLKRNYIGIELNPEYIEIAERRIRGATEPLF